MIRHKAGLIAAAVKKPAAIRPALSRRGIGTSDVEEPDDILTSLQTKHANTLVKLGCLTLKVRVIIEEDASATALMQHEP